MIALLLDIDSIGVTRFLVGFVIFRFTLFNRLVRCQTMIVVLLIVVVGLFIIGGDVVLLIYDRGVAITVSKHETRWHLFVDCYRLHLLRNGIAAVCNFCAVPMEKLCSWSLIRSSIGILVVLVFGGSVAWTKSPNWNSTFFTVISYPVIIALGGSVGWTPSDLGLRLMLAPWSIFVVVVWNSAMQMYIYIVPLGVVCIVRCEAHAHRQPRSSSRCSYRPRRIFLRHSNMLFIKMFLTVNPQWS